MHSLRTTHAYSYRRDVQDAGIELSTTCRGRQCRVPEPDGRCRQRRVRLPSVEAA